MEKGVALLTQKMSKGVATEEVMNLSYLKKQLKQMLSLGVTSVFPKARISSKFDRLSLIL